VGEESERQQIAKTIAWVEEVGRPMRTEVEGLKRAFWWAAGGIFWAGIIVGGLSPYVLKKLGLG
jgi:hypothetical protein